MATATQEFTNLSNIVKAIVDLTQADAAAYATQLDTINQAYQGPYASQIASGLANVRNGYGDLLKRYQAILRTQVLGILKSSTINLGGSLSNFAEAVAQLRKWMYDNSTVLVLQPQTNTLVAAVGNVGDGITQKITVDKYGFNLANIYNGVALIKCINDTTMNAKAGFEVFQVIPQNEGNDIVGQYGKSTYGTQTTFRSVNPVTATLITNGFWNSTTQAAGVVSALGGDWEMTGTTTLADFTADTTSLWRSEDTTQSLGFFNNSGAPLGAAQTIAVQSTITKVLKTNLPYTGYVVYRNETDGAAADLTLTIGTKSTTVNLADASGVAGAISLLQWKLDEDAYLENFKPVPTGPGETQPVCEIEVVNAIGMADGAGVKIYGVFWTQCGALGRCPMLKSGGNIDWVLGDYDTFTNTYTAAGTGKNIQALRDQLGITLPSKPTGTGGYTVIADPA